MSNYEAWYAVRCCCTPVKVLGFLKIPILANSSIVIIDDYGVKQTINLRILSDVLFRSDETGESMINAVDEIAICSDKRPIKFWRRFGRRFKEIGFVPIICPVTNRPCLNPECYHETHSNGHRDYGFDSQHWTCVGNPAKSD